MAATLGHKKPPAGGWAKGRKLLGSLGLTALILALGLVLVDGIDLRRIMVGLIRPLIRLMLLITLGLFVGQVIETTGWTRRMAILAAPLFRFGRLGNRCSATFTAAFISGAAANAMLLDFHKEGKIRRRQLFLTNLMNQFPAYFLHLPTTFFIVIPLTGWAGGLYFLLTFIAVVLRCILLLVYGHLRLPAPGEAIHAGGPAADQNRQTQPGVTLTKIRESIESRLPKRIMGVAIYVIPIYTLVFVINAAGFFALARQWMAGFVVTTIMPVESLSVVVFSFAAEFTSGFAAAGALLEAGVLTTKQTVLALLIGNIVAFPIRALRHQLPRYMGIFAPKMGLQLLLLGQGFRVTSLVFVGVFYYLWF